MKEEYKKLIMELLESFDAKALQSIYSFILGIRSQERRCGMSVKRSKEKDRRIAAINEILHATESLWILEQIYRCAKNMTKEDGE